MTELTVQKSKLRLQAGTAPRRRFPVLSILALGALAAALTGCGDDDDPVDGEDGGRANAGASGGGRAGSSTGGMPSGGGGSSNGGASGGQAGEGEEPPETIDPDMFDGEQVFRFDTFGSEQFWTGKLRIHEAIQAALDPLTALKLGFKVDAAVLPDGILEQVDLEDPATTVALIKMNAVIGVQGEVDAAGNLTSVGITCALCHSDVDNSVQAGIGLRMDGHANRDLDPGMIISLAPALAEDEAALAVVKSWGPGFYDPRWNLDGRDDTAVTIPPIYGLAGVPLATYTGDGPVSYWNQYVAVTQMGGQGQFYDSRIDVAVLQTPDLVTPKLPALYDYQMSLEAPAPDVEDLDEQAIERGSVVFNGAGECSSCHMGPRLTDAADRLHEPAETDMEPTHAARSATGMYRTTPLRALALHPPYFHDGSAATLEAVVDHYDAALELGLTAQQRADLVVYLQTL